MKWPAPMGAGRKKGKRGPGLLFRPSIPKKEVGSGVFHHGGRKREKKKGKKGASTLCRSRKKEGIDDCTHRAKKESRGGNWTEGEKKGGDDNAPAERWARKRKELKSPKDKCHFKVIRL